MGRSGVLLASPVAHRSGILLPALARAAGIRQGTKF
jgi:hypothetical protein